MLRKISALSITCAIVLQVIIMGLFPVFAESSAMYEAGDPLKIVSQFGTPPGDGDVKPLPKLLPDPIAMSAGIKSVDSTDVESEVVISEYDDGIVVPEENQCGSFEDIDQEHILCKYLDVAKNYGVVSENSRFYVEAPITRGQFVALVVRAFDFEVDTSGEGFADVPSDHTFYEPIMTLQSMEIVSGREIDGELLFGPDFPIRRGGAMKILVNSLEYLGTIEFPEVPVDLDEEFSDGGLEQNVFAPFLERLVAANDAGLLPEPIVNGFSDGQIKMFRPITRIQAITMVLRAMRAAELVDDIPEILPAPLLTVTVDDPIVCEYNGEKKVPGENFMDSDGCNMCSCSDNGFVYCTQAACEI